MRDDHGILPQISHYTCMVDLLARTGHVKEAENLLQFVHKDVQQDITGWAPLLPACRSLLFACGRYGDVEVARRCFDRIAQSDPFDATGYVLMSGIYSDARMWNDAEKIEELRECAGAWKKPAKAWIEANDSMHEFVGGHKCEESYAMLKTLNNRMEEEGYMPKVDLVSQKM